MTTAQRDALEQKVKKFDELRQMRETVGNLLATCGTKPGSSPGEPEVPYNLRIAFTKFKTHRGGRGVTVDETLAVGPAAGDETEGILWLMVGAIRGGLLRAAEALDRRLLDLRPDLDRLTTAEANPLDPAPPSPPAEQPF